MRRMRTGRMRRLRLVAITSSMHSLGGPAKSQATEAVLIVGGLGLAFLLQLFLSSLGKLFPRLCHLLKLRAMIGRSRASHIATFVGMLAVFVQLLH